MQHQVEVRPKGVLGRVLPGLHAFAVQQIVRLGGGGGKTSCYKVILHPRMAYIYLDRCRP